ncbi:MAG: hypothetical protein ABI686_10070 [Acidobacteriota bacterium]
MPETRIKVDFNDDPRVIQALSGKMDFPAFKTAAEAKDGTNCEQPSGSNTYGVNPLTGKFYFCGFSLRMQNLRNLHRFPNIQSAYFIDKVFPMSAQRLSREKPI